jgi:hypothetical protein
VALRSRAGGDQPQELDDAGTSPAGSSSGLWTEAFRDPTVGCRDSLGKAPRGRRTGRVVGPALEAHTVQIDSIHRARWPAGRLQRRSTGFSTRDAANKDSGFVSPAGPSVPGGGESDGTRNASATEAAIAIRVSL